MAPAADLDIFFTCKSSTITVAWFWQIVIEALCRKYFVSIQTRREVEAPVHSSTSVVGIGGGDQRGGLISGLSKFARGVLLEAGRHFSPGRAAFPLTQNDPHPKLEKAWSTISRRCWD